jgi:hypothetical protein
LKLFALLNEALYDMEEGDFDCARDGVMMALNLLTVGNEEGEKEEENAG